MSEEENKGKVYLDYNSGAHEREFFKNMNAKIEAAKKLSAEKRAGEDPLIYGFKLSFKDGEPRIEEYGNMKFTETGLPIREPLTDVMNGKTHVSVIMELPGVNERDIDLKIEANKVDLNVESGNKVYHKEVLINCPIDPKTVEATFKNGILEVRLNRIN